MKRIVVLGCSGSGKTTFAQKLNKCTGIPLFHLDAIWHKPDRTHISREEFDRRLADIMAQEEWIIDGNYQRTMERRIKGCDGVFLLKYPSSLKKTVIYRWCYNPYMCIPNHVCTRSFWQNKTLPCSTFMFLH